MVWNIRGITDKELVGLTRHLIEQIPDLNKYLANAQLSLQFNIGSYVLSCTRNNLSRLARFLASYENTLAFLREEQLPLFREPYFIINSIAIDQFHSMLSYKVTTTLLSYPGEQDPHFARMGAKLLDFKNI